MTVYILSWEESGNILAVYSTREKAEVHLSDLASWGLNPDNYRIDEYEVDDYV